METSFSTTRTAPRLVGKTASFELEGDWAFSNHMTRLRPKRGVLSRFVAYQLHFVWTSGYFQHICTKHVNQASVASRRLAKAVLLLVPPTAEQERIVAAIDEHFSDLDAAEASLRRASLKLRRLELAAVARALRGDWEWKTLEDFTVDQRYGSSAKATRDPTGVPILRMGNIKDGEISLDDLKYLPLDHPDLSTCCLEPGDLLFNRTNSPELVGKAAVFHGCREQVACASYLIRVRLSKRLHPDWAALVINGPVGRNYVARVRTQQVGQANVNGTKLKGMPVPAPPVKVQEARIAEFSEQKDLIGRLRRALADTHLRAALLGGPFLRRLSQVSWSSPLDNETAEATRA